MSNESVLVCESSAGNLNMTQNYSAVTICTDSARGISSRPTSCRILDLHFEDKRFVKKNNNKNKNHTSVITIHVQIHSHLALPYLAGLVVEPDQGVIPGENFAVEGGVVLGRPAASHRPADLDWLIQVDMPLLEWVRVGSAGEHGQRRRH